MIETARGMTERLITALEILSARDPNSEDAVSFFRDVDGAPAFVVVLNSGETFRVDVRQKGN